MIQLRFIDFFCPTYDPIREKESQLYIKTRDDEVEIDRLRLAQRLRKAQDAHEMDKIKDGNDLKNFIKQTEHELGLKDIIRDDEMKRLQLQFAAGMEKTNLGYAIEIEGIKSEEKRRQAWLELEADIKKVKLSKEADREHRVKDTEAEDTALRIGIKRDFDEAMDGVELREANEKLELEVEQKQLEMEGKKLEQRSRATAEALLSIVSGPEAQAITQLEELRMREKFTPEQLLAMAAASSPAVAQALAEKYRSEAFISKERLQQLENFVKQQKEMHEAWADRLERVTKEVLVQMGATATTRAQGPQPGSQTIVAPGLGSALP